MSGIGISIQEIVVRLLAAVLLCGAVGLQRAITGKSAGMRTHILVGIGAALFTLVSGYAFGVKGVSADRITAQVVTGIGFIGGGAILKERGTIKGLTTAAGLWAVAAISMAAGAGLYSMGVATTIIVLLTLVALRRLEIHFPRRAMENWSITLALAPGATVDGMRHVLVPRRRVRLVSLVGGDETHLTVSAEVPRTVDIVDLTDQLRAAGALTVSWQATDTVALEDEA